MEDRTVLELARIAGLEKAIRLFPDDVVAAAQLARDAAAGFTAPSDPAAEPWPPMSLRRAP